MHTDWNKSRINVVNVTSEYIIKVSTINRDFRKTLLLISFKFTLGDGFWLKTHFMRNTSSEGSLCACIQKNSSNAFNFQRKISIIIGMVVFDVEPTKKHFHPLLSYVFNLLYGEYSSEHCNLFVLRAQVSDYREFFILVDLLFYKLFKKS